MAPSFDLAPPAADDAPRCADFARLGGIDPGGTAIAVDRVILVATPLPWPKPALDHPLLQGLAAVLRRATRPTRLLAAAPGPGMEPVVADSAITVRVFDRAGGSATERTFAVASAPELEALGRALVADGPDGSGDPAADLAISMTDQPEPAVLVCTQGSHDVCCGSDGTRLADELGRRGGIRVFRVSHTGGHRFAPTAMVLPSGRMWAYLDADLVIDLATGTVDPATVADRCRGWWGAPTGGPQVAERAVLAEVGAPLDQVGRTVTALTVDPELGAGSYRVDAEGLGSWTVEIAVGRTVPTVACRQAGGEPLKVATEYRVLAVERR